MCFSILLVKTSCLETFSICFQNFQPFQSLLTNAYISICLQFNLELTSLPKPFESLWCKNGGAGSDLTADILSPISREKPVPRRGGARTHLSLDACPEQPLSLQKSEANLNLQLCSSYQSSHVNLHAVLER